MSEIDTMSTTSQAQSPTYIPSSHSLLPIPVLSRHVVMDNPISPHSAANILDSGTYLNPNTLQGIANVTVDKSVREEDRSDDEEKDEDVKDNRVVQSSHCPVHCRVH